MFFKTMPIEIINKLSSIRSVIALRICFLIPKKGFISEEELCKSLNKTDSDIKKLCHILIEKDILYRWKSIEDGTIFYSFDPKFFDADATCKECPYSTIEKAKGVKFYGCKAEFNCRYEDIRTMHGLFKIMKKKFVNKSIEFIQIREKENEIKNDNVTSWNEKDFVKFYIKRFRKSYSNLIPPTGVQVRNHIRLCIRIIKSRCKDNWRRLVKQYFKSMFLEKTFVFTGKMISDPICIQKFLSNAGKKIQNVEFCDKKSVFCSYCIGKQCQLERSNIKCTSTVVDKMKELYN